MQDQEKEFEYKNWQQGIADSPEDGFSNMVCCNIERYPKAITPGYQTVKTNSTPVFLTIVSSTSTVITFTGLTAGQTLYTGQAVQFSNSFSGPGVITAGTIYYILPGSSSTTMSVVATLGNAINNQTPLNVTNATGTINDIAMTQVMDIKIYYPTSITTNPVVFAADANGRAWMQSQTGSTITSLTQGVWYLIFETGNTVNSTSVGLCLYTEPNASNTWLFLASGNTLYTMNLNATSGLLSGVGSGTILINTGFIGNAGISPGNWTDFYTFTTSYYHSGFVSQTGTMYWTDGENVYGFAEVNGQTFDGAPHSSPTKYAFNPMAVLGFLMRRKLSTHIFSQKAK